MAFTHTAEDFQRRNEFFSERGIDAIEAAIVEAQLYVSLQVCIDSSKTPAEGQALYDAIVEAKTAELLLSGGNGLPTSVTKESGMLTDVRNRLRILRNIATPRCGVARD